MKLNLTNRFLLRIKIPDLLFIFLFFLSPFASIHAQCSDNYVQIGSYHVEFVGVEYDFPNEGQSTWYYTVIATSGKDISHVTFPLNKNCINVLDAGVWGDNIDDLYSGLDIPSVGKDPKAKIWGLKFDKGIDKGDERNYYFTIENNLMVEPVHEVSIKAGRPFYKGTVCGPSPDCSEVSIEPLTSCISGMVFHDKNIDGIRAVDDDPVAGIEVKLYSFSGQVESMMTDEDGKYSFCDLAIDNYMIQIVSSAEMITTVPNVGSDEFDSDIVDGQFTEVINIAYEGESITNIDGGYFSFGLWDLGFVVNSDLQNQFDQVRTNESNGVDLENTFENNYLPNEADHKIQIYPNPVVSGARVVLDPNRIDEVVFEIRDQQNQLILSSNISIHESEKQFDLSSLANGIYFAYIISDTGIQVEKIIKAD